MKNIKVNLGKVKYKKGNVGAWPWICFCGNTPIFDGYFPCNKEGNQVKPTKEKWTTNQCICARCGRIIDLNTLEIVGLNLEPKILN